MQHKGFNLMYPMKIKIIIFRNSKKNIPGSNRSNTEVANTAVGRDILYASADCFFESDLRLLAFSNSAYPENWALFYLFYLCIL